MTMTLCKLGFALRETQGTFARSAVLTYLL